MRLRNDISAVLFFGIILERNFFAEAAQKVHPNNHQKYVLQNTVKALLDFKRLPMPGEVIRPLSKTGNAASKYMRQLFKKYQSSNGAKLSNEQGNIVRSISPSLGVYNRKYALTFNLHTVKPTEEIISAEVHFNLRTRSSKRRYSKNGKKRPNDEIRCVVESTAGKTELSKRETTVNWLSYDARGVIETLLRRQDRESLGISSQDNKLLAERMAVRFLRVRRNGSLKNISADNALRRHTPFLLLHTNDPVLMDKEQVMSALYDSTPANDEQDIEQNRVRRDLHPSSVNTPHNYYSYKVAEGKAKDGHYSGTYKNNDSNELTLHVRAFQSQGPDILQTRKEIRKNRKKQRKAKRRHRKKGELPYPDDYRRAKFGQKDIVSVGDPKTNDVSGLYPDQPSVVLLGTGKQGFSGRMIPQSVCAKHDLVVEFQDVGWGQWIIAPKSFEAHYCAGTCPFPLTPESNPSNHATIQSIIHAIGLHPYVPAVCCAPTKGLTTNYVTLTLLTWSTRFARKSPGRNF